MYLKRLFYKLLGHTPATVEMVQYWKTGDAAPSKVTQKDGYTIMKIFGEKYDFPGFPRGYLLYGQLSTLKHEIKNQIFNDSWAKLEKGEDIGDYVKTVLPNIYDILRKQEYEILPPESMVPPVREIHRALTLVAPDHPEFVKLITYILQEDDAYRFRVQWIASWFGWMKWFYPVRAFERSLVWLEHAEIIGDMKERIRLLRRVLLALLQDEAWRKRFETFFRECDWSKIKMSKADKYYFRGKYFRVDLDKFNY